jgi:hypothetical protein
LAPELSGATDDSAVLPARLTARIAGALYLIVIAGGLFAEAVVLGSLTVRGDAAATARSIAANESLWRWGIGVHFLYLACAGIAMYVLFYLLFRRAQPTLALAAFAFAITSAAIEGASLLQLYVPLAIIENQSALAGMSEGERHALAYLAIQLYETGFGFALLFFSGFCAAIGLLILRSRLVPRVIGVMMVLAGICYLVNSLATIVAPGLAALLFPWILLPCLVGEASLAMWLVVKGVDAAKLPR